MALAADPPLARLASATADQDTSFESSGEATLEEKTNTDSSFEDLLAQALEMNVLSESQAAKIEEGIK